MVRKGQATNAAASRRGPAFARSTPPAVDEQALIRRYTRDRWSMAACARRFSISLYHAREILTRNDVEIRVPGRTASLDENDVVRAYRKHRSLNYVARVMHTTAERVQAILDEHGEPHGVHTPPPDIGAGQRPVLARYLQRPPAEPSLADLLRVCQAARMLGIREGYLKAAARAGQIHETRSPGGQRQYTRRDLVGFRAPPRPYRHGQRGGPFTGGLARCYSGSHSGGQAMNKRSSPPRAL